MNNLIKKISLAGIVAVSLFLSSCNEQKSQNQKKNNKEIISKKGQHKQNNRNKTTPKQTKKPNTKL